METLFPQDRQGQITVFCVVLSGLAYWLISFFQYPDNPLSVVVLYRGTDDSALYSLIRALSQCTIGESVVHEYSGLGVRSTPFTPMIIHAVLFRLLGPAGFIVADVLFMWLYYSLATALLRAVGIQQKLSRLASFCLTLGVLNFSFTIAFSSPFSLLNTHILFNFWDMRFPRSLVSGPIFLLALLALVTLFNSTKALRGKIVWVILGLATAGLIQADFHSSMVFSLCVVPVLLFILLMSKSQRRIIIKGIVFCVLAGTLVSLPFFIQRLAEHPDIPLRSGLFSLDRSAFLFQPQGLRFAILVFLLFIFLEFLKRSFPDSVNAIHSRSSRLFSYLCLSACFSLPISVFLLGKTIQPYHFKMVSDTYSSYAMLIHLLILFEVAAAILQPFRDRVFRRRLWHIVYIFAVMLCLLLFSMRMALKTTRLTNHIRADIPEWKNLPDYRVHFVALVQELQSKKYTSCRVVGTFDSQVTYWWLTFGGGKGFLVDPMISTLSDDEVESRLIDFCRLLGMTPNTFSAFISQNYINLFWLGLNKYQASRAHTFSHLEDYSPEDRKRILSTPGVQHWEETWTVFIPLSEQKRLRARFEREKSLHSRRLDLIILNRNEIAAGLSPVSQDFVLEFENPVFQVWVRKGLNKSN